MSEHDTSTTRGAGVAGHLDLGRPDLGEHSLGPGELPPFVRRLSGKAGEPHIEPVLIEAASKTTPGGSGWLAT
jgi:hypothetical protein